MTLIETDLLLALKELYESSKTLTSGAAHSDEDVVRYQRALAWSERLINLEEIEEKLGQ